MGLSWCADVSAADWIAESAVPFATLVTFGPDGFEAYARLRYIPDPQRPGQKEMDVDLPDDHPSDSEQAARALNVLAGFTATPRECFFAVWEGYPDLPLPRDVPLFEVPNRRFALLSGSLDATRAFFADKQPPAYVWPADRRWCFTSDVDPHWAGIGAPGAAIDALTVAPIFDVVPADPARVQPFYY